VLHQSAPSPQPQPAFGRALIVDDHPLFCDALSMTLRSVAQIGDIDLADRLATALARIDAGPAHDLVVLDLNLPDVNGIDGLIRLKQAVGAVRVLVVSSLTDARVIAACLAAGAAGYVPKHSHREVFRAAFDSIAAGRRYLPDGFDPGPATPAPSPRAAVIARMSLLTRQQARILELICEGKLNKQIAWELSIAETTVKAHVTAIMRKLGVYSRTQAVLVARETSFASLSLDEG
jgi:DNA-binding NarL/FixJ family response regulator